MAMSARARKRWPRGHAAGVEAERRARGRRGAVQREQPVRGPHERDVVVVAAARRVAHHLRDRQARDRFVERFLQRARERLPLREAAQVDVVRPCRRTST